MCSSIILTIDQRRYRKNISITQYFNDSHCQLMQSINQLHFYHNHSNTFNMPKPIRTTANKIPPAGNACTSALSPANGPPTVAAAPMAAMNEGEDNTNTPWMDWSNTNISFLVAFLLPIDSTNFPTMDPDFDRGDPERPLPDVLTDAWGKHPKTVATEREGMAISEPHPAARKTSTVETCAHKMQYSCSKSGRERG